MPVERNKPVHHEFASKFEVPRMIMGFNTVDADDPDMPALEVVQAILSSGKTSRFYKKFIEGEEIASQAEASDTWGRYPGWFGVQLELLPGKDRKHAEELVLAELKKLADEPVPADELNRVRTGIISPGRFSIAKASTTWRIIWLRGWWPTI